MYNVMGKSITREAQKKVEHIFVGTLFTLLFLWYMCIGFSLELNCIALDRNQTRVESDNSKIKVSYINKDDKIYLEDTTNIDGDSVDEYVRVPEGVGTYIIYSEGLTLMTSEVLESSLLDMGTPFMVIDWAVFIFIAIFTVFKVFKKYMMVAVTVFTSSLSYIVLNFYITKMFSSEFPLIIVISARFALLIGYSLVKMVLEKRTSKIKK